MSPQCAVLGSPIGHSLSPVLHRAAYDVLGLNWSYVAVEVTEAGLADFLDSCGSQWRGLSLTMPLKRTVLPLLSEYDETVALSGVANTVVLDGGARRGSNTDIPGAVAAMRERTSAPLHTAVVLGGGATAASTLLALTELGCTDAVLAVRTPARAQETLAVLARHPQAPTIRVTTLAGVAEDRAMSADICISTIPADAQEPALADALATVPVLFDVVYHPWPTPLVQQARTQGATVVSGLDLLVHQAVLQVGLMTGRSTDGLLAPMRAAGEAALGGSR